MTAFISHSSKDKAFVGLVANALGSLAIEYDEATFDFTLNVQAIRQALKRSSIVAFFVSQNSIHSTFVAEEQRQALEALGRGDIKRIMIFTIDDTSHRALPDWMREINIVQRVSNAKACARRIQSALVEIDAQSTLDLVYIGRESEEAALRKALAVPKDRSPVVVHVAGFHGVGRRTFVKKSMRRVMPRYYDSFVEIAASQHEGLEDLYRSMYQLEVVSSVKDTILAFESFAEKKFGEQASIVSKLIKDLVSDGSMLLVVDDFGVFDDAGDYQDHWKSILSEISDVDRPIVGFIQSRTQPYKFRELYPRSFHIRVGELNDADSKDLIALSLREESVDFDNNQLKSLAELVDGHPFNLRFAVGFAKHYGLKNFLMDPRDFIEWKHRRGEEFLDKLEFGALERDIVSALAEYRYMSADLLLSALDTSPEQMMESMRALQDFCCVEFRNGFFQLSSPIRESIRRDQRFLHDDVWHEELAQAICDVAAEYEEDENAPLSIIEAAAFAQARGAKAPAYLKNLVLPSHLLIIAREQYDKQLRPQCIEFCKRAYDMKDRMTLDARVETLRLWGLSAARSNDSHEFNIAIGELKSFSYPTATRIRLFLEGFFARLKGRLDVAERRFKDAWDLAPKNPHINRELASLYCRQKRYEEAEEYARSSYEIQRTNPYIIDILLETLIGKKSSGKPVDDSEINRLKGELRTHSIESSTLFFNLRQAQEKLATKDYKAAADEVENAIHLNNAIPSAYFLGVEAELGRSNVNGAEKYLAEVRALLEKQGQSEGDEIKIVESEVNILIEKRQYLSAKNVIEKSSNLPVSFLSRLRHSLARTISFDSSNSTLELNRWAAEQLNV